MSAAPVVTIIIVNWNTADLLEACLASIVRGTTLPHEVLVVDNASTDDSCRRVTAGFPHVRLFPQSANLGFARANNVALAAAQGRFLLLLNPDTELRAGAVEALAGFLSEHPRVGIAGPPLWNPDGTPQPSVQLFPTLHTEWLRQTMLYRVVPSRLRSEGIRRDTRRVDVVTGAALCIRRECYERVGPLDEDIFMFYEDVDWCRRAHVAGWETWYVDGPGVMHHHGGASVGPAFTRALLDSLRGTVHYFRKHEGDDSVRRLRAIAFFGAVARSLRAAALYATRRDPANQKARLRAYARMIRWAVTGGEL